MAWSARGAACSAPVRARGRARPTGASRARGVRLRWRRAASRDAGERPREFGGARAAAVRGGAVLSRRMARERRDLQLVDAAACARAPPGPGAGATQPAAASREHVAAPAERAQCRRRSRPAVSAPSGLAPGRSVRDREFRGRGRRRCAQVRDEVCDREIDLVADAGDQRQAEPGDRARERLVIEGEEVLERPAAAHQEQDVDFAASVREREHRRDFARGARALHGHGVEEHRNAEEAAAQHVEHVPERGAGGRRHDANAAPGSGAGARLRAASNSPSAASFCLSASNRRRSSPSPASSRWSTTSWNSPRAS